MMHSKNLTSWHLSLILRTVDHNPLLLCFNDKPTSVQIDASKFSFFAHFQKKHTWKDLA